MSKTLRKTVRGLIMASGLATCAALMAAPVTADEGSTIDPAIVEHSDLVDWREVLVEDHGVDWTVVLPDPQAADVDTQNGITPAGAEWTRVTAVDPSGVEWTRLSASDPDGSSWVQTSSTDPNGVEWTFLAYDGADGSSWVESHFVDVDGRDWSRRAPGDDLDGVEWT